MEHEYRRTLRSKLVCMLRPPPDKLALIVGYTGSLGTRYRNRLHWDGGHYSTASVICTET